MTPLFERLLFYTLIIAALLMLVGCGFQLEARRSYHYSVTTAPDGTVIKAIDVEITNSDTSLGQLTAVGADGTRLELTDLTAEERVSAANQALAEGLNKLIDKVPPVPLP